MSANGSGGGGKYDGLSHAQLAELLERRDRQKKLGLVWERDEIEADRALQAEFVAADLLPDRCDPANGQGGWPNLVIEGDNFDALRWLRMTLAGRVKCIYVDPPYNTGAKDWVYNDHYVSKEDRYRHSTWLEFLYRRFALARDLLTVDGVILVSINDENRAKLELMLDEVLPGMRVGSLVWRTRVGGNEGGAAFLSDNHEHVLIYAKAEFRFGGNQKSFEMYRHKDKDGEKYRISDLTVAVAYDNPRAGQAYYPLYDPVTDIYYPANPDRVWSFASRARSAVNARVKTRFMEDWIAADRIAFPNPTRSVTYNTLDELRAAVADKQVPLSGGRPIIREDLPGFEDWVGRAIGFGTPGFKRYKKDLKYETQPLSSWIVSKSELDPIVTGQNEVITGTNEEGTKEIKSLFGRKAFSFPKPPSLIRGLLEQSTSAGDLVLDFFAGSATTAQAVMQLNAEDGGERRFIMVSSTEATAEEPDKNLCDAVTAERVRRLNASDDPAYAALNAPFAYLKTAKVGLADFDYDITPARAWATLEALHGLPLTLWDEGAAWCEHASDEVVLILAERVDDPLITRLRALAARRAPAFVYARAPGQITGATGPLDLEVRPLRESLVSRFRA